MATPLRIAAKISAKSRLRRRSTSCTTTSRSAPVVADGERGAGAWLHVAWALVDRQLDVLRIVVHAADDDQVLQPAGDEQLAVVQEAQVAGAQERARGRRRRRAWNVCCVASSRLPVALGHAGAGDPDLADLVRPARRRTSRDRR